MSLLRKSETKHVVTKTLRETNTPPKYLQSNHSSKGVRSTSYVHRTFVDAEPAVGKTDARFDQPGKKKGSFFAKTNKGKDGNLLKLAKAVGVDPADVEGKMLRTLKQMSLSELKEAISEKLRPDKLEETFKNLKGGKASIALIYRLVMSDTPKSKKDEELKSEIRQNIMGGVKLNGLNDVSKTQQNETNKAAPKEEETKTAKTAPTKEEIEAEALEKKYEKFRIFFEKLVTKDFKASKKLAQVMAKLKNNDKPKIKQMLKNLNAIITRIAIGGGQFQNGQRIALLVDKLDNEDKSISFKEMKSALRNNANKKKGKVVFKDDFIPLKQILFKDMHFKNFSELLIFMDSDKDGKLSIIEFANMYLRAKLTQALERDINENFIDETYTEMLKLFGIGDETATVDNGKVVPVVTPSKKPTVDNNNGGETKTSGEFKVGDIVRNISAKGIGVGFTGKITKMKPKSADVTWTNGEKSTNKKLIQLEMVTTLLEEEEVKVPPPPAPQTEVSPPAPPPAPQTTFKVGDIVKNLSTKGRNVDSVGIITEMKKEKADVTWQDGNQTNNKKLTDLKLVTIDPATEKKIKDIFDFYDTKRKDGNLDNVESLKFLRENLKRISQVFSKKELFSQPDGKSGISFEEFRFMLTVIPDTIAKFEKEVEKEEAKSEPQRKRQPDPDKVKQKQEQEAAAIKIQAAARTRQQKEQARQKEEQARQAALARQEQARQAALARQKETEKAVLENQKRNEAEKQQRDADEKKIIVEKKDGIYFVRQTKAYKDYKEKLEGPDGIPETACKPETTTNN